MSNEPERPIEKALRACAKKRREDAGGPLELHPATRRLLQGEVARQFGRQGRDPRPFSIFIAGLWPKAVLGVAVLGIIGLLAAILIPALNKSNPPSTLARNERRMLAPTETAIGTAPASEFESAPVAVNGPAHELQLADNKTSGDRRSEALSLSSGKTDTEKNGVLSLTEPAAGEKKMNLETAALDSLAKTELPKVTPATPPVSSSVEASDKELRRYGLAGNLKQPQPLPTSPAQHQSESRKSAVADGSLGKPGEKSAAGELAYKSLSAPATAAVPGANKNEKAYFFTEGGTKGKDTSVVQRFTQLGAASKDQTSSSEKASPAQTLLVSFQVEQNGRELRIVDQDGSVYSGFVQLAGGSSRLLSTETGKAAPTKAFRARVADQVDTLQAKQVPQNYFFRVTGTNRSLKENVVFTGTLLAVTNASVSGVATNFGGVGGGAAPSGQAKKVEPVSLPALQLPDSRISGKALIGDGKVLEIRAVPVAP
jgi:hypothetical protein